jgi:hypothetical protein
VLVSLQHGAVVFDLVEGATLDGYQERQDDAPANRLQQRLLGYKDLLDRRRLRGEERGG